MTTSQKARALAQAVESLRRAARDVATATRELTQLSEAERASLLASVSKDLRELQTQVNAEVGAILVNAVAEGDRDNAKVETVYDRIRREAAARTRANEDRERRMRDLAEGRHTS